MNKKVMLAFTGGLQSSVAVHWLSKKRGARVTALIVELGAKAPGCDLAEKAVELGATGAHVEDCRDEFIRDYAYKALRASAVYERRYLLSAALTRPLIAHVLVRLAHEEGFQCIALGTCRDSNDAGRFRQNVAALNPGLELIVPEDIPPLANREAALKYAEKNSIVPFGGKDASLSYDINLWGAATAASPDLGTWEPLPEIPSLHLADNPRNAPEAPDMLELDFEEGFPVRIDGVDMDPKGLVEHLNGRAGRYGIGCHEVVEDRLLGLKSREYYEAPGAYVLLEAHSALEELCLDYQTRQVKLDIGHKYASIVYSGGWFSMLREAYDAFVDVTQKKITGRLKVKLQAGAVTVVGRRSPHSLFDQAALQERRQTCSFLFPDIL